MPPDKTDPTARLIEAGVAEWRGNQLRMTDLGRRLLRTGLGGLTGHGDPAINPVPITSKLARSKPHQKPKKKKHR